MGNLAIKVENLGKMYRIGGPHESYKTFRDAITNTVSAPIKRARDLLRGQAYGAAGLAEEIWALKDVSFEVKHGEVVGIIGRNGAGKSTLLKILSRITEPTTGYADVYGHVGALLEVGTGFHPELTGRENVYLNGAILGMSRNDINRKFDEIVEFAGVEKFIDTPVKHYSSGMGLRLGFSVAAHLEPDILVVDEVLAVGDVEFQRKCIGKMNEVAGEGRTVLFVSHNLGAVSQLCHRGMVLNDGKIVLFDITSNALAHYTNGLQESKENPGVTQGLIKLSNLSLENDNFNPAHSTTFSLKVAVHKDLSDIRIAITIYDEKQLWIVGEVITSPMFPDLLKKGYFRLKAELPALWLSPGQYTCYAKATITAGLDVRSVRSDPLFLTCKRESSNLVGKERILSVPVQWDVKEEKL